MLYIFDTETMLIVDESAVDVSYQVYGGTNKFLHFRILLQISTANNKK
jgi:hypothetical protein